MAKLNKAAVEEILQKPYSRGSGAALARKFGVSETVVSGIRTGKRWAGFQRVDALILTLEAQ